MCSSFCPSCITRENKRRDVGRKLWPDRQQRADGQEGEDSERGNVLEVELQLYSQKCRVKINALVAFLCVYITEYE